jgi:primosomal protein N' (replication factor Y)
MPSAIAQVEPLTTARALRGPFDYRLPPDFGGGVVGVGSMLLVPFGRREVLGVVTGFSERSGVAEEKLLAPLRALDEGPPALPVDLVALAEWIAAEYCSTLARALTLMLPPGATRGARPVERLVASLTPDGRALAEGGSEVPRVRLTARQRELLVALGERPLPAANLPGGSAALRRLADRGLLTLGYRKFARRPAHLSVGVRRPSPPPLTGEQHQALGELRELLARRGAARRLLHGVTGSGKTEVYLRLVQAALEQGRGAIVMVPEIALTPQIVARFIERFGDTVAVTHSRLSVGERHDEWRRLRSGRARICVGPRSAVFAPIEDLGLIVLDEEHDSSYKHEGDPRYDAREVAAKRAAQQGALLLVGSATPRPESRHAVKRLSLPRRVDGRPLPPVEVLDTREQSHGLHPETSQALADLRRGGGKAIVLLNRRGWSNFLSCRSCGRVWSCPQCDVALVLHRTEGRVRCHHCGHGERVPARCECGSTAVARHGTGTERLQHDLRAALGDGERFPIFRLDADVLATGAAAATAEGGVGAVLRRFGSAPAGVLIGTQMVAKGHDFPDVRLGVVLDADATLRFPDFRAEERTFALIAQLAGRVGRGGEGRVLVQTIAPQARAIAHAAEHDSEGFLAGELERRAALRYPPFAHLIRVVCAAAQAPRAQAAASAVREGLDRLPPAHASVLGPAALFRLRGRERRVLMVKAADRGGAVRCVGAAVQRAASAREHAGVSFSVDVDPQ